MAPIVATSDSTPSTANVPRHVKAKTDRSAIRSGARTFPTELRFWYADSTRTRTLEGYESSRSGWWSAATLPVLRPSATDTMANPQSRVTNPVLIPNTLHATPVATQRRARRARRCTKAAMGRGDSDTARVLTARSAANAPFSSPRVRAMSGVSTLNA
jgi:hypothetical protein